MAVAFKHYSGDLELKGIFPIRETIVRAKFPAGRIVRSDSFDLLVGTADGRYDTQNFVPVTRRICYKTNGTKHECGPRCRGAKGHNCECSCGGQFHGVDA